VVDLQTVDEIFFMVPSILNIHEKFLEELGKRLDAWDPLQRVGDSYYDIVSFVRVCIGSNISLIP
jgi:Rho guanine nucleotide exchange factor 17